jgi:ABC-type amino acid transport substrate-binding protein
MRNIFLFVIATILLGGLVACANQEVNENDEVKEVEQVLTIGMSGGYKPYTYINDEGNLVGFDVSVWEAIGEELEMEVVFETSEFSGLFGKLDNGQLTTIANQITVTDERSQKYLFSNPYVYYGAQLVVHEENNEIVDLETLKGKKVGVSLGSNYESMIKEFDVDNEIEVITYEDFQASLRDVSLGRIDAVLNDKLALETVIVESGLNIKFGGEPVSELHNAFPFVMSDENKELLERVNNAIDTLSENGTLSEISLEFFPIDITN